MPNVCFLPQGFNCIPTECIKHPEESSPTCVCAAQLRSAGLAIEMDLEMDLGCVAGIFRPSSRKGRERLVSFLCQDEIKMMHWKMSNCFWSKVFGSLMLKIWRFRTVFFLCSHCNGQNCVLTEAAGLNASELCIVGAGGAGGCYYTPVY